MDTQYFKTIQFAKGSVIPWVLFEIGILASDFFEQNAFLLFSLISPLFLTLYLIGFHKKHLWLGALINTLIIYILIIYIFSEASRLH